MQKRIIANNQIKAREVRLIDKQGNQLGVIPLQEALKRAYEAQSDLIQVTEKVSPPVCKITDFGKYAYQLGKKTKKVKSQRAGELKNIRLSFAIFEHDLETRAKTAEKFLLDGFKIRVEMPLRGREKALGDFAISKMKKFYEMLKIKIPIKIEKELKRDPRGFTMIIAKL